VIRGLQAVIQTSSASDTTVVGVDSAAGARGADGDSDYDLVLLDLSLGDADGFDVLVELRTAYPALPVVVVSASDRASDVIRAIDRARWASCPSVVQRPAARGAAHGDVGGLYVPPMMLGLDRPRRRDGDTVPGVMRPG
jgi:CheY-like chemotaxis protein